jgi:hypothetical protein
MNPVRRAALVRALRARVRVRGGAVRAPKVLPNRPPQALKASSLAPAVLPRGPTVTGQEPHVSSRPDQRALCEWESSLLKVSALLSSASGKDAFHPLVSLCCALHASIPLPREAWSLEQWYPPLTAPSPTAHAFAMAPRSNALRTLSRRGTVSPKEAERSFAELSASDLAWIAVAHLGWRVSDSASLSKATIALATFLARHGPPSDELPPLFGPTSQRFAAPPSVALSVADAVRAAHQHSLPERALPSGETLPPRIRASDAFRVPATDVAPSASLVEHTASLTGKSVAQSLHLASQRVATVMGHVHTDDHHSIPVHPAPRVAQHIPRTTPSPHEWSGGLPSPLGAVKQWQTEHDSQYATRVAAARATRYPSTRDSLVVQQAEQRYRSQRPERQRPSLVQHSRSLDAFFTPSRQASSTNIQWSNPRFLRGRSDPAQLLTVVAHGAEFLASANRTATPAKWQSPGPPFSPHVLLTHTQWDRIDQHSTDTAAEADASHLSGKELETDGTVILKRAARVAALRLAAEHPETAAELMPTLPTRVDFGFGAMLRETPALLPEEPLSDAAAEHRLELLRSMSDEDAASLTMRQAATSLAIAGSDGPGASALERVAPSLLRATPPSFRGSLTLDPPAGASASCLAAFRILASLTTPTPVHTGTNILHRPAPTVPSDYYADELMTAILGLARAPFEVVALLGALQTERVSVLSAAVRMCVDMGDVVTAHTIIESAAASLSPRLSWLEAPDDVPIELCSLYSELCRTAHANALHQQCVMGMEVALSKGVLVDAEAAVAAIESTALVTGRGELLLEDHQSETTDPEALWMEVEAVLLASTVPGIAPTKERMVVPEYDALRAAVRDEPSLGAVLTELNDPRRSFLQGIALGGQGEVARAAWLSLFGGASLLQPLGLDTLLPWVEGLVGSDTVSPSDCPLHGRGILVDGRETRHPPPDVASRLIVASATALCVAQRPDEALCLLQRTGVLPRETAQAALDALVGEPAGRAVSAQFSETANNLDLPGTVAQVCAELARLGQPLSALALVESDAVQRLGGDVGVALMSSLCETADLELAARLLRVMVQKCPPDEWKSEALSEALSDAFQAVVRAVARNRPPVPDGLASVSDTEASPTEPSGDQHHQRQREARRWNALRGRVVLSEGSEQRMKVDRRATVSNAPVVPSPTQRLGMTIGAPSRNSAIGRSIDAVGGSILSILGLGEKQRPPPQAVPEDQHFVPSSRSAMEAAWTPLLRAMSDAELRIHSASALAHPHAARAVSHLLRTPLVRTIADGSMELRSEQLRSVSLPPLERDTMSVPERLAEASTTIHLACNLACETLVGLSASLATTERDEDSHSMWDLWEQTLEVLHSLVREWPIPTAAATTPIRPEALRPVPLLRAGLMDPCAIPCLPPSASLLRAQRLRAEHREWALAEDQHPLPETVTGMSVDGWAAVAGWFPVGASLFRSAVSLPQPTQTALPRQPTASRQQREALLGWWSKRLQHARETLRAAERVARRAQQRLDGAKRSLERQTTTLLDNQSVRDRQDDRVASVKMAVEQAEAALAEAQHSQQRAADELERLEVQFDRHTSHTEEGDVDPSLHRFSREASPKSATLERLLNDIHSRPSTTEHMGLPTSTTINPRADVAQLVEQLSRAAAGETRA